MSLLQKSIEAIASTWTGDINGFHELHNHPIYLRLFGIIGEQVREYISGLQINEQLFDYYYTRSWAAKQVQDKMIAHHRHEQSHIMLSITQEFQKNLVTFM